MTATLDSLAAQLTAIGQQITTLSQQVNTTYSNINNALITWQRRVILALQGADTSVTLDTLAANLAALKADLDASVAAVEAEIKGIGTPTSPPPPPPVNWVQYPADAADQPFMPWNLPAALGPTAPELPSGYVGAAGATLAAGTFAGVMDVTANATVSGAGPGKTIIDCSNLSPIYQKAVVVCEASTTAAGALIENLTIRGAAIPHSIGGNAAGICNGGQGYNYSATNVEVYGCQEGLRGLGGNVTLNSVHLHHNGSDTCDIGCSHGCYFNENGAHPATPDTITANYCVFELNLFGHEFKSREGNHVTTGCVFNSSIIPGATGSFSVGQLGGNGSCVDISNGGNWTSTNDVFVKGIGVANRNFITFNNDAEGVGGSWEGNATLTNPTFCNPGEYTTYIIVEGASTLTLVNPTSIGPIPTWAPGTKVVVEGTWNVLPANTPIPTRSPPVG